MNPIIERISNIGIVPVVKVNKIAHAIPMMQALYDGGIDAAEITFRSEHAKEAIEIVSKTIPNMLVGAGTVLNVEQAKAACDAGASFIVTPGFNAKVVEWCIENNIPVLPGISTASELETALSYGITTVKFFPAESSGGAKKIKDLSAPYQHVKFLPTGGIGLSNMHEYLSLPSVLAIGGSFMIPENLVNDENWEELSKLSRQAVKTMLDFKLTHLGINHENEEQSKQTAQTLCDLFNFTFYNKPKSKFAGVGFELLNSKGRGVNGHIGIYTPYPERALYHLEKKGVHGINETITRNKRTNKINFVYLDKEIAGFAIHLINPDLKMEV